MMIMVMYLFSTKNGCNFINWWQRLLFRGKKNDIAARPMTRHTSIVTFIGTDDVAVDFLPVADVLLR